MTVSNNLDRMSNLYNEWKDCKACPLHNGRKQIVFGVGNVVDPKVFILGEAPGPTEDERGIPFIGRTGSKFRETLIRVGIDPNLDCFITNSVICFPTTGGTTFRNPTGLEIAACRPRLQEQIKIVAPSVKVILLVGRRAYGAFFEWEKMAKGELETETAWNKIKFGKLLGWYRGDLPEGYPKICTIYHPSYIVRNGANEADVLFVSWRLMLKKVADYIKQPKEEEAPAIN